MLQFALALMPLNTRLLDIIRSRVSLKELKTEIYLLWFDRP